MNALPDEDRAYRPWLHYLAARRKVFCTCCIFPDKSEQLRQRGKDYYWTTGRKVKTRDQLARFLRQHWGCGHHDWEGTWQ